VSVYALASSVSGIRPITTSITRRCGVHSCK